MHNDQHGQCLRNLVEGKPENRAYARLRARLSFLVDFDSD